MFTEVWSCYFLQVFCCLLNHKLLLLSFCLAVALSVCLPLSHSPFSLLWGVKKEPMGDLGSIMQVCSCAFSCRLFAPHIAFLPIETHTHPHNLWHLHRTSHMQRELNFGSLCASCARCKAKRCLTSSALPRAIKACWKRKKKWLSDAGIHYVLCGRCYCWVFVHLQSVSALRMKFWERSEGVTWSFVYAVIKYLSD